MGIDGISMAGIDVVEHWSDIALKQEEQSIQQNSHGEPDSEPGMVAGMVVGVVTGLMTLAFCTLVALVLRRRQHQRACAHGDPGAALEALEAEVPTMQTQTAVTPMATMPVLPPRQHLAASELDHRLAGHAGDLL